MITKRISAPYSFVPLNKDVYIPAWYNKVSQDIPFEDGEDGIIEVKWRNVSPLIIRDGSCGKSEVAQSVFVDMPDGTRRYFIPGSSIKGMLRNVMAIMSFGKFNSFTDRKFGYRNISDQRYRTMMSNVRHGWLQKSGKDYILYPCIGEVEKIDIKKVEALYPKYKNNNEEESAWERNEAIGKNSFPERECKCITYRLFATGKMQEKMHELLIPDDTDDGEVLSEDVWKSFFTVYKPTPDFDKYKEMMENGKKIPVGYIREKKTGRVKEIGMGKMLRHLCKNSVDDLVRKEQKEEQGHDLCETIFGWTDKNDSMKGRVQIGNAFCETVGDVEDKNIVKGVLGEPRASYYPLYLKQDENKTEHNKYDNDNSRISGWKRYRIHQGSTTHELPEGNDKEKTISKFCPLKQGLTFTMRISVHNLRKVEIGALLSAITFHHTEGIWHSIGGAKSFGYGKLECDFSSIKLSGLQYNTEEYLAAFEEEMNKFTQAKINGNWTSCRQIKTLVAIASEHTDEMVSMMKLEEYTETKNYAKKNPFFYLPYPENTSRCLNTAITEEYKKKQQEEATKQKAEKVRKENAAKYTEIETLHKDGNLELAKLKLEELIRLLQKECVDTEPEQKQLEELEREIVEAFMKKGLNGTLNEKYDDGERFKVNSWKTCASKIGTWMKRKKEVALTAEEQYVLAKVVCRLKSAPDKKEEKHWQQADSKIWKEVAAYLSKERADRLFNGEECYD